MRRILFLMPLFALFFAACSEKNPQIGGEIRSLADTLVSLRPMFLAQQKTDTLRADKRGKFRFRLEPSADGPRFFRLALPSLDTLIVPVDSTEKIVVSVKNGNIFVKNSENTQHILRIRAELADLEREKPVSPENFAHFKQKIRNQIFSDPSSSVAFYSLLLSVDGQPLFDIRQRADRQFFSMVATAYSVRHPRSVLTKWLAEKLRAEQTERVLGKNMDALLSLERKGLIDIVLPDVNGTVRRLSEQEGNVVLLAFSFFAMPHAAEETAALQHLQAQYAQRGLTIFSVSFDVDYEFWHTQATRLPWLCTHDEKALNSPLLSLYNTESLPVYFLINRSGEVLSRHNAPDKDMEKEIVKVL